MPAPGSALPVQGTFAPLPVDGGEVILDLGRFLHDIGNWGMNRSVRYVGLAMTLGCGNGNCTFRLGQERQETSKYV